MGSWDPVWEQIFASRSWGRYPPEELIRFIVRTFGRCPDRRALRILDLGCGPGPCTWFLAREGFFPIGLDASPTALRQARERLGGEGLAGAFVRADFTALPLASGSFDGAFDIASVQQNPVADIRRILAEVRRLLVPGASYFAMMLATGSWGEGLGREVEPGTWRDIADGPYQGEGNTHFAAEAEIREWFSGFAALSLEMSSRTADQRRHEVRHWVITATR